MKIVAGEEKTARNFGPPTFPGPTLRGSTLPGPTLRGPTLRGPTLCRPKIQPCASARALAQSHLERRSTPGHDGPTPSVNDVIGDARYAGLA